jgi:hypothetical protein
VYEARGSVGADLLIDGARAVQAFGERSLASTVLLDADPARPGEWLTQALGAVDRVLAAGPRAHFERGERGRLSPRAK